MNWRIFNELYETRQKVEFNLNNFIEKKEKKSSILMKNSFNYLPARFVKHMKDL